MWAQDPEMNKVIVLCQLQDDYVVRLESETAENNRDKAIVIAVSQTFLQDSGC